MENALVQNRSSCDIHQSQEAFIMARREKKPVPKVVMTEGKRQIIQQLLQERHRNRRRHPGCSQRSLGGTIKEMMEAEMVSPRV